MKEIPLSQNKVALVDDEDYNRLNKVRWYAHKERDIWYADRKNGGGKPLVIRMARQIMKNPIGMFVDHIDGNGLNNQKSNLRICTNAENLHNRGVQKNNTTGYKGVCWDKEKGKYRASISFECKRINLGRFSSKREAAIAYNKAAIKYHGEFAYRNKIATG